eukprot:CAMPEP_0114618506 /NCGR_PEP_ID=MMETSP0168-20121206/7735_1 /TAXON_ID=95228 ORGANISM="Vannella sp., Strain DIVA3 517/6/12" /NCGR_SAMPLE_ID=MMETSP0168 /ASSEMBLY_ACC=CAM_ASM_000044 /LENGTH=129 /DNA_ID=CAMNT_0001829649 /DNA_START=9 /DNA_END=398 /DNA_ORIENTATION=-
MSWDAYVENLKAQGIVKANVSGLDGNPWARGDGSIQEVQEMVNAIQTPDFEESMGVTYDGERFVIIKVDRTDRVLYAACGLKNLCACLTRRCIVVGTAEEPRKASIPVQKMTDYLLEFEQVGMHTKRAD